MAAQITVLAVIAIASQVQSQVCPNVGIKVPVPEAQILPAPVCQTAPVVSLPTTYFTPAVSPIPLISTTVVDNSVANSLANALQLLIVSELIESSMNTPYVTTPLLTNIGPVYDAIGTIGTVYSPNDVLVPAVDIVSPTTYGNVVDITSNVVTEIVSPQMTTYPNVVGVNEVITPSVYPNYYSPVEVVSPISQVTEVISPVTSTVTTNIYGGNDVINPTVDVYSSVTEIINPVVSAPQASYNPYYGYTEIVPPYTPGYVTEVTEFISPIPEVISFGGCKEMYNPIQASIPLTAEVIFPQSIPAQLKCNFAYPPPMPVAC